ncbi:MAG TPA: protein kinase [Streptosporangiaceae bacterium]|nr:protein kinase [Streptosporangiaceae bacterium]
MTDQGSEPPAEFGVSGEFSVGSVIAGYRLEERIGAGGMAVVFRAYDSRLDRQVALKLLAPELARDDSFRRRFIRESRAAAAVDDPHIIPVFEAGESAGVLFIAMRYVRGGDVRSLIDQGGALPPGRVADIVSQAAAALDAAHARGLVHRDVKPANMLLEARSAPDLPDHVYLSDFGLTKTSLGTSLALTGTGEFLGTLEYVAPEQIEGLPLDGRCDEYSLACSAFEMLCGQPPFRREPSISVMYAHLSEPPPAVRQYRPGLPAAIDEVLQRALAKAPDDRYPSCGEFAAALRQLLAGQPDSKGRAAADQTATQFAVPAVAAASGPATQGADPWRDLRRGNSLPGPAAAPPVRSRPWWRSPAPIGGIGVLVVALAVGGFFVASRGHARAGASGATVGSSLPAAALTPPGCTTATAPAKTLGEVASDSLSLPGPFGVAVRGPYAFVSGGNAVTVLSDNGSALLPTLLRTISVPGANKGDAITHDGRYVLAAAGSGAVVVDVAAAVDGAYPIVGSLVSPSGSGAAEVALSADDTYAFVTLQDSAEVAVFNLKTALAGGFGPADFVGDVPVGPSPVGLADDDDSLFVASEKGELNVLSLEKAETDPSRAVTATVTAGCGPARAVVSADQKVLWVTASESDALLGFSTARLQSDPDHALVADVRVGESPLGVALVDGGSRLVVADSDQHNTAGASASLAVIDTARALARQPSLLGYLPTGMLPRQFALAAGGKTLLVTVTNSNQLQAIHVGDLP